MNRRGHELAHVLSRAGIVLFMYILLDRALNPTDAVVDLCEWMISRTRDAVTIPCIVMLDRSPVVGMQRSDLI